MILKGTVDYKGVKIQETLKNLDSSINGLNKIEVENRVHAYGYNEVVEKKCFKGIFIKVLGAYSLVIRNSSNIFFCFSFSFNRSN